MSGHDWWNYIFHLVCCYLAPYVLRGLCPCASCQVWKLGSIPMLFARKLKHWKVGFLQGHLIDLRWSCNGVESFQISVSREWQGLWFSPIFRVKNQRIKVMKVIKVCSGSQLFNELLIEITGLIMKLLFSGIWIKCPIAGCFLGQHWWEHDTPSL